VRLTDIHVNHFRSIEDASLKDCGDLNVLIGKNNSGKSNLLSAVQIFFDFLTAEGNVATVDLPIRELTDWHKRNLKPPVVITALLRPSADEMQTIRKEIADEAPQMRNALEEISAETEIECQLTFQNEPQEVGYISKLAFADSSDSAANRTILSLSVEAGYETANKVKETRALRRQIEGLTYALGEFATMPPEDWRGIKDRRMPVSVVLRRSRSRNALNDETLQLINQLVRRSESIEDFRTLASAGHSEAEGRLAEILGAENKHRVQTFSGESVTIPGYVTKVAALIGSLKVHHLLEQRQPIGGDEASRFLSLKTSRGQGAVLQEIQTTVSELLGVRIDAFSSDSNTARASLIEAELDVDDFLVQVNGSGIRESLRLILDNEFERPNILLVEEPEVHLHPALEIAMMQYLRKISADCQVFLTTHSTNFLDVADLRNVYLITKDDSTHTQLLNVQDAEEAIPEELGIRLSSLFMYDRLVFVEGPSDEQVLRAFASTLGINLGRVGVGFVTTGGARNFTHYANASTLGFLAKRRVKLYFIIDRDERDILEIENLRTRLADMGQLSVLRRRELENYLMIPRVLAKYIPQKGNLPPIDDPSEIEDMITAAANDLLETAAERRVLRLACRPVIPDRRKVIDRGDQDFISALQDRMAEAEACLANSTGQIASWLEEARKSVEETNTAERLSLIPGDEILTSVFRHYGLRYNKRKDGPKIAILMNASEIESELATLLRNLTQ
jgi:putative ATP-dependent endonuclease of OLD family